MSIKLEQLSDMYYYDLLSNCLSVQSFVPNRERKMASESSKTSGTVETPFLLFKWICDMRQFIYGLVSITS